MIASAVVLVALVIVGVAYFAGRGRSRTIYARDMRAEIGAATARYVVATADAVYSGDSASASGVIEDLRKAGTPWVLYVDGVEKKRGQ